MRISSCIVLLLAMFLPVCADKTSNAPFTEEFPFEESKFSSEGRNPYFSLQPGDRLILKGEEDGETLLLHITVLPDTRWIAFRTKSGDTVSVRTRVVEEREWIDGELVEVSRNFFARCRETNAVYYFGEDVDIYEDGAVAGHGGAWLAGDDDALPGLIMPGTFLLGARYFQEQAPGVAMDRGENVAMGLTLMVPAGPFTDCVEVLETSALDPEDESVKRYCPGIGLVYDDGAELVEFESVPDEVGD